MTPDAISALPAHERIRLKMAASGLSRTAIVADDDLTDESALRFESLVARRLSGEPLQYLEGTAQFGPIEIAIDGRALIPRPETEVMWEDAVRSLGEAGPGTVIVDLCTGSGAMALALKAAFPSARVYGADIDSEALALATENAARLGVDVAFYEGDLFEALPTDLKGRIDLVVANPPYVAEAEWRELPPDVREHEPKVALVPGPDGTEALARLAEEVYWWLGIGGWMFCEIGATQGDIADELFGSLDREIRQDLTGRDRYVAGRKGASCCL